MEALKTLETAPPGAALASGGDPASLSRRARLRSSDSGIIWRSREGSPPDADLVGREPRRLGHADGLATGVEDGARAQQWRTVAADAHVLPDARPVVFLRPLGKSRPAGEARSRRVLVVDDDAGTRRLCAAILELAALEVNEAVDGRAGLVRARLQRPDLIVTDIAMPGLDGFQLVEALRREERTRAIPVIFLSGEPEPGNHARAFRLGAAAYVTKPFNPVSFASLATRVLSDGNAAMRGSGRQAAREET